MPLSCSGVAGTVGSIAEAQSAFRWWVLCYPVVRCASPSAKRCLMTGLIGPWPIEKMTEIAIMAKRMRPISFSYRCHQTSPMGCLLPGASAKS